jgi:hypothetical protein
MRRKIEVALNPAPAPTPFRNHTTLNFYLQKNSKFLPTKKYIFIIKIIYLIPPQTYLLHINSIPTTTYYINFSISRDLYMSSVSENGRRRLFLVDGYTL